MLIDEILYRLVRIGDTTSLDEGLAMALRFQIDNVAHFVYEYYPPDIANMKAPADLVPNIAPLAPVMWFEYSGSAVGKDPMKRFGCLVSVCYDREETPDHVWADTAMRAEIRWIIRLHCFYHLPQGLCSTNWIHYQSITDEGAFEDFIARERSPYSLQSAYDDKNAPFSQMYVEEFIALFAICFSHCKGTEIKEIPVSRQVRRAAERAKKTLYTFHTIDINPSANILRTEGHISENGLARALHICRGHFAHYTVEKPLFGKYTGTFYRPMHIRGKAEQGVSIKDYRVHPPIQNEQGVTS